MRKIILELGVLLILVGGMVLIWQGKPERLKQVAQQIPLIESLLPTPCSEPIPYSIGNFDARFGISEDDFRVAIQEAGSVWESASGRTLFVYDEVADFKINLIYDERQQETDRLKALAESLAEVQKSQMVLNEKQELLLDRYTAQKKAYEKYLAQFQRDERKYNETVAYWNSRGGAPDDDYKKIMKERASLKKAYAELEKKREALNALALSLNATHQVETKIVEGYNAKVAEYRENYGEPEEFQEGLYTGTEINIYQFEDRSQLLLVLAHELGHVLGIEHVADPTAIMYHFLAEQPATVTLGMADRLALRAVCDLP